jgi:hypothetical protein
MIISPLWNVRPHSEADGVHGGVGAGGDERLHQGDELTFAEPLALLGEDEAAQGVLASCSTWTRGET